MTDTEQSNATEIILRCDAITHLPAALVGSALEKSLKHAPVVLSEEHVLLIALMPGGMMSALERHRPGDPEFTVILCQLMWNCQ
ncbi:MAG: hypothetical protein A2Z25_01240 [Planctomycetes bacterium RBG_16_55_9]|nr:MAG: hypothetical protein A2Z25_01240 [Planctomycetes bacterium RBG_16_55_9]